MIIRPKALRSCTPNRSTIHIYGLHWCRTATIPVLHLSGRGKGCVTIRRCSHCTLYWTGGSRLAQSGSGAICAKLLETLLRTVPQRGVLSLGRAARNSTADRWFWCLCRFLAVETMEPPLPTLTLS